MRDKPERPGDNECCESGCEPCVWDTYYAELMEWQQEQKQHEEDHAQASVQDSGSGTALAGA